MNPISNKLGIYKVIRQIKITCKHCENETRQTFSSCYSFISAKLVMMSQTIIKKLKCTLNTVLVHLINYIVKRQQYNIEFIMVSICQIVLGQTQSINSLNLNMISHFKQKITKTKNKVRASTAKIIRLYPISGKK